MSGRIFWGLTHERQTFPAQPPASDSHPPRPGRQLVRRLVLAWGDGLHVILHSTKADGLTIEGDVVGPRSSLTC